jgi:hypothetical protein
MVTITIIQPTAVMAKKAKKKSSISKKSKQLRPQTSAIRRLKSSGFVKDKYILNLDDIRRWKLPSGARLTPNQRHKFELLDTCSRDELFKRLNIYIHNPSSFTFPQGSITEWKPPPFIKSLLASIRQRNINDWKKVKNIYIKLVQFYASMDKLVYTRKVYRYLKNVKNTEDIVTMDTPKKPVYIIDTLNKCSHVYEASTIRKIIENRICLSDHMFPTPQSPRNPLTNTIFTRGQLMSIILQCKHYEQTSWILDALWKCECELYRFKTRFKQPLKVHAIEAFFRGDAGSYKETVVDFFEYYAIDHELPDSKINLFSYEFDSNRSSFFIREWVNLTRRFYIAKELNDTLEAACIQRDVMKLLVKSYVVL